VARPRRAALGRSPAVGAVALALASALACALFLPQPAAALCPNCLAQNDVLTPTFKLVGIFLLVPFVVALIVWRAIRKAGGLQSTPMPPSGPTLPPSEAAAGGAGGTQAG
jgi:hypothetical protein